MPCTRAKSGLSLSRPPPHYSHPNHRQPVDGDSKRNLNVPAHDDPMSDKAMPFQMRQTHYVLDAAGVQRDNPVTRALWSREIWQKIKEVPTDSMDIDGYLTRFVPADERIPLPECPPVGRSFSQIGEGGLEAAMYGPLVSTQDSVLVMDGTTVDMDRR